MKNEYQNKLLHLATEEIEELMKRYYNGEKNNILIEEYAIDVRSTLLIKTFPIKIYNDKLCQFCNIPMVSYRESKSSYSHEAIFCRKCNHLLNDSYCKCEVCIKIRIEEQKDRERIENQIILKQREVLMTEYLERSENAIDIEQLSLKGKLYISALLRTALSEDLINIQPLSSRILTLAPIDRYKMNIIAYLKNENIILLAPNTLLDSVVIENNEVIEYYPLKVTFRANLNESADIKNLLYLKDNDDIGEKLRLELWHEIGLYECLEFLYARLDEYSLPTDHIGEKTNLAIKEALKSFSISQVYNFIWRATTNVAAFSQKNNISKKHAVNTIAGAIIKSSERALAEEWDVKKYGRNYDYPQTVISEVFFNNILKIGDKGFDSVPY